MDKEKFNKAVGRRISASRQEKDILAETVAEDAGIALQTLSNIEGGKRACKTTTIYGICKSIGVSSDYVLGLSEPDAYGDILLLLQQLDSKEIPVVENLIRSLLDAYHH